MRIFGKEIPISNFGSVEVFELRDSSLNTRGTLIRYYGGSIVYLIRYTRILCLNYLVKEYIPKLTRIRFIQHGYNGYCVSDIASLWSKKSGDGGCDIKGTRFIIHVYRVQHICIREKYSQSVLKRGPLSTLPKLFLQKTSICN